MNLTKNIFVYITNAYNLNFFLKKRKHKSLKIYISSKIVKNLLFFPKNSLIYPSDPFFSNLIMFYIYLSKTPFFERYRVDPDRPWPWEDPQQFSKFLPKVVQSISLEILLQTLIIMVATYLPVDFRYDLESFPTKWQIIWQVGFFMLTDDFFFYWAHRVMHMPYFYKRFHKQHHEFQTSVTIATVIFL